MDQPVLQQSFKISNNNKTQENNMKLIYTESDSWDASTDIK